MRQEVQNSFVEGLSSDLNPLIAQNTVLTDCLNGTYITYNGNDFTLQNDMGNYGLKNCKLDPNYIPMGIQEYAGIIYIVSYNPITNKMQVGSYPSPKTIFDSDQNAETESDITDIIIPKGGDNLGKPTSDKPTFDQTYFDYLWASKTINSDDTPINFYCVNYDYIKNKGLLHQFTSPNMDDIKLYPGDEYYIYVEADTTPGVDNTQNLPSNITKYGFQTLQYYILSDDKKLYSLSNYEINEQYVQSNTSFKPVQWEIPGYLTYKTSIPNLYRCNLIIKSLGILRDHKTLYPNAVTCSFYTSIEIMDTDLKEYLLENSDGDGYRLKVRYSFYKDKFNSEDPAIIDLKFPTGNSNIVNEITLNRLNDLVYINKNSYENSSNYYNPITVGTFDNFIVEDEQNKIQAVRFTSSSEDYPDMLCFAKITKASDMNLTRSIFTSFNEFNTTTSYETTNNGATIIFSDENTGKAESDGQVFAINDNSVQITSWTPQGKDETIYNYNNLYITCVPYLEYLPQGEEDGSGVNPVTEIIYEQYRQTYTIPLSVLLGMSSVNIGANKYWWKTHYNNFNRTTENCYYELFFDVSSKVNDNSNQWHYILLSVSDNNQLWVVKSHNNTDNGQEQIFNGSLSNNEILVSFKWFFQKRDNPFHILAEDEFDVESYYILLFYYSSLSPDQILNSYAQTINEHQVFDLDAFKANISIITNKCLPVLTTRLTTTAKLDEGNDDSTRNYLYNNRVNFQAINSWYHQYNTTSVTYMITGMPTTEQYSVGDVASTTKNLLSVPDYEIEFEGEYAGFATKSKSQNISIDRENGYIFDIQDLVDSSSLDDLIEEKWYDNIDRVPFAWENNQWQTIKPYTTKKLVNNYADNDDENQILYHFSNISVAKGIDYRYDIKYDDLYYGRLFSQSKISLDIEHPWKYHNVSEWHSQKNSYGDNFCDIDAFVWDINSMSTSGNTQYGKDGNGSDAGTYSTQTYNGGNQTIGAKLIVSYQAMDLHKKTINNPRSIALKCEHYKIDGRYKMYDTSSSNIGSFEFVLFDVYSGNMHVHQEGSQNDDKYVGDYKKGFIGTPLYIEQNSDHVKFIFDNYDNYSFYAIKRADGYINNVTSFPVNQNGYYLNKNIDKDNKTYTYLQYKGYDRSDHDALLPVEVSCESLRNQYEPIESDRRLMLDQTYYSYNWINGFTDKLNIDFLLLNRMVDIFNTTDVGLPDGSKTVDNLHTMPPIFPIIYFIDSKSVWSVKNINDYENTTTWYKTPKIMRSVYQNTGDIKPYINNNTLPDFIDTIGLNDDYINSGTTVNDIPTHTQYEEYLSISWGCVTIDGSQSFITLIPYNINNEIKYFNDNKQSGIGNVASLIGQTPWNDFRPATSLKCEQDSPDIEINIYLNSIKNYLNTYKQLYNDNGNYNYPCEFNRHIEKNWVGRHVTIMNNSNNRFVKLLTPGDWNDNCAVFSYNKNNFLGKNNITDSKKMLDNYLYYFKNSGYALDSSYNINDNYFNNFNCNFIFNTTVTNTNIYQSSIEAQIEECSGNNIYSQIEVYRNNMNTGKWSIGMDKITNSVDTSNSVKAFNCLPYTYAPYNIGYKRDLSLSSTFILKLNNLFEEAICGNGITTAYYNATKPHYFNNNSLFVGLKTCYVEENSTVSPADVIYGGYEIVDGKAVAKMKKNNYNNYSYYFNETLGRIIISNDFTSLTELNYND